jgi:hypothetical protein
MVRAPPTDPHRTSLTAGTSLARCLCASLLACLPACLPACVLACVAGHSVPRWVRFREAPAHHWLPLRRPQRGRDHAAFRAGVARGCHQSRLGRHGACLCAWLVCFVGGEQRCCGLRRFCALRAKWLFDIIRCALSVVTRSTCTALQVGIHPTDAEAFVSMGVTRRAGEDWVSLGGCGGGKCG